MWKFFLFSDIYNNAVLLQTYEFDTADLCDCETGRWQPKCDGKSSCQNRLLYIKCPVECGPNCQNRRIQQNSRSNNKLALFHTFNKGIGVKALTDISEEDLIIEYTGEIISFSMYKERVLTVYKDAEHYYCMELQNGLVIDGHTMGNEGGLATVAN